MQEDKRIHFGWWLGWRVRDAGMKDTDFAKKIEMTPRQFSRIKKEPDPVSNPATLKLAEKVLGVELLGETAPWRFEAVIEPPPPKRREKGQAAKENAMAYFRGLLESSKFSEFDLLIMILSRLRNVRAQELEKLVRAQVEETKAIAMAREEADSFSIDSDRGMRSAEAAKPDTDPPKPKP